METYEREVNQFKVICTSITVAVCVLILVSFGSCQMTNYRIAQMVEMGATSMEASCAVSSEAVQSNCTIYELIRKDREDKQ